MARNRLPVFEAVLASTIGRGRGLGRYRGLCPAAVWSREVIVTSGLASGRDRS